MKEETTVPWWFPCQPTPLLGALQAMRPHVGYVYCIVLFRIYEEGGPIKDSVDALTRRTGYRKALVVEALDELFRDGRLVPTGDGIMNPVAASVLVDMMERIGTGSLEAKSRAQRRREKPEGKQGIDDAESQLQLEVISPSGEIPAPEKKAPRRKPRFPMAEDWEPNNMDVAYAAKQGFASRDVVDKMARRFKNHHQSKGTLIADLAATWRTWVDNQVEFDADRARRAAGGRPPGHRSAFELLTGGKK